jgi:hypothetical protein
LPLLEEDDDEAPPIVGASAAAHENVATVTKKESTARITGDLSNADAARKLLSRWFKKMSQVADP